LAFENGFSGASDSALDLEVNMGLGTSLLLIAVGAVLRFAVNVSTSGFNVHTVGIILIVVGVVGLLISLVWMTSLRDRTRARGGYVRRDVPPADTY
jgi:putative Mn2+ efflux pump MntP